MNNGKYTSSFFAARSQGQRKVFCGLEQMSLCIQREEQSMAEFGAGSKYPDASAGND